jgi:hypothetical protein
MLIVSGALLTDRFKLCTSATSTPPTLRRSPELREGCGASPALCGGSQGTCGGLEEPPTTMGIRRSCERARQEEAPRTIGLVRRAPRFRTGGTCVTGLGGRGPSHSPP